MLAALRSRAGTHLRKGLTRWSAVERRRIVRVGLMGTGLAGLLGATACAVASVSIWLVPAYLLLVIAILTAPRGPRGSTAAPGSLRRLVGIGRSHALAEPGRAPGADRADEAGSPEPASDAGAGPASPDDANADADADSQPAGLRVDPAESAVPSKPRRSRARSRKTAKPAVEPAADAAPVTWIRVGPGQYVRSDAASQGPPPAPNEPVPETRADADAGIPVADIAEVPEPALATPATTTERYTQTETVEEPLAPVDPTLPTPVAAASEDPATDPADVPAPVVDPVEDPATVPAAPAMTMTVDVDVATAGPTVAPLEVLPTAREPEEVDARTSAEPATVSHPATDDAPEAMVPAPTSEADAPGLPPVEEASEVPEPSVPASFEAGGLPVCESESGSELETGSVAGIEGDCAAHAAPEPPIGSEPGSELESLPEVESQSRSEFESVADAGPPAEEYGIAPSAPFRSRSALGESSFPSGWREREPSSIPRPGNGPRDRRHHQRPTAERAGILRGRRGRSYRRTTNLGPTTADSTRRIPREAAARRAFGRIEHVRRDWRARSPPA